MERIGTSFLNPTSTKETEKRGIPMFPPTSDVLGKGGGEGGRVEGEGCLADVGRSKPPEKLSSPKLLPENPSGQMQTATSDFAWPLSAEHYVLDTKIGIGAFATVWMAHCVAFETPRLVAIKIMDLEILSNSFEEIRMEVNMMRLADHPNTVRCYCSFVTGKELWLVMEYMNMGSCLRVISVSRKKGKKEGMLEKWVAYILYETLQGLAYFHNNGQLHRDIKAGNILLSRDGRVQLADFGVAGWLVGNGKRRKTTRSFVGTPCWMAPEVMEQLDGYDQRADVWSIGITALELAKGFAPYAKLEPMKVLLKTIEQDPPSLKTYEEDKQADGEAFSRPFKEFVRLCLQKLPKKRPSVATLLNHSFFKKHNLAAAKESLIQDLLNHLRTVPSVASPPAHNGEIVAKYGNPIGAAAAKPKCASSDVANTGGEGGGVAKDADVMREQVRGGSERARMEVKLPPPSTIGERPIGTTWVFDDGSHVVLKGTDSAKGENHETDEIEDFYQEFEAAGFKSDALTQSTQNKEG